MTELARAPRAVLSVAAGDDRKIARALESTADEIILDLEDAVPPDRKDAARRSLLDRDWSGTRQDLVVRVNAARTPWAPADLIALAGPDLPFGAVLVPKIESAGDLAFVDRLLDGAETAAGRSQPLAVHALIENAAGIRALEEITTSSPRLQRLVIGYADLAASLRRQRGASWAYYQESVLSAARAAGLTAIDGPYLDVDDGDTFQAAVQEAADLGFDGKWVIHPRQVRAVNDRFTPSPDAVDHARRVVAALEQAHAAGTGVLALDGAMIDEALAAAARGVLARALRSAG